MDVIISEFGMNNSWFEKLQILQGTERGTLLTAKRRDFNDLAVSQPSCILSHTNKNDIAVSQPAGILSHTNKRL